MEASCTQNYGNTGPTGFLLSKKMSSRAKVENPPPLDLPFLEAMLPAMLERARQPPACNFYCSFIFGTDKQQRSKENASGISCMYTFTPGKAVFGHALTVTLPCETALPTFSKSSCFGMQFMRQEFCSMSFPQLCGSEDMKKENNPNLLSPGHMTDLKRWSATWKRMSRACGPLGPSNWNKNGLWLKKIQNKGMKASEDYSPPTFQSHTRTQEKSVQEV